MTVEEWWDNHHKQGGSVWRVTANWSLVDSPEKWIEEIYDRFSKLRFEEVEQFINSSVIDNRMPNREVLEEGSKIYYLTRELSQNQINFVPQLLHEPWYYRYRIHPGSGRTSAIWLNKLETFPCIYIHFDEPEFSVPKNSVKLTSIRDFVDATIWQKPTLPEFETYPAGNCQRTRAMDSEWQYPKYNHHSPWHFIRWSEGSKFLNYKKNWRECALDLWLELNEG